MSDWYTMDVMAQERRNDMLRDAQTAQMLREAFGPENRQHSIRGRLLIGLGRRLTDLGGRLQAAYCGAVEAPNLRPRKT
jgi:hypothetical protein